MDSLDPYRPPQADLETEGEQGWRAGRGARLGAALIDGCVSWILTGLPVLFLTSAGSTGVLPVLVATFLGNLLFAGMQASFLLSASATLGKRAVGLAVCSVSGSRASPMQLLVLRPSLQVVMVLSQLPLLLIGEGANRAFLDLGAGTVAPSAEVIAALLVPCAITLLLLVDTLLIFRQDRRCLHDLIAGTIVVKTELWQSRLAGRPATDAALPARATTERRGVI